MSTEYKNKFIAKLKDFIEELNEKAGCEGTTEFLNLFENLEMDKVIEKYYLNTKDIKEELDSKDERLFDNDVYILPGINISDKMKKVTPKRRKRFFTYIQLLAILAESIIKEEEKEENKDSFNPYTGIGDSSSKSDYDVNKLFSAMNVEIPDQKKSTSGGPNLGMLAQAAGLNQLINPEELKKQLKSITPDKIKEMKQNMSKIMGDLGDGDEGTNKTMTTMLDTIFDEISKSDLSNSDNPFTKILGLAENVSKKIENKVNPEDFDKLVNSSVKLASKAKDQDGNPLLDQMNNLNMDDPTSFLTEMMKKINK